MLDCLFCLSEIHRLQTPSKNMTLVILLIILFHACRIFPDKSIHTEYNINTIKEASVENHPLNAQDTVIPPSSGQPNKYGPFSCLWTDLQGQPFLLHLDRLARTGRNGKPHSGARHFKLPTIFDLMVNVRTTGMRNSHFWKWGFGGMGLHIAGELQRTDISDLFMYELLSHNRHFFFRWVTSVLCSNNNYYIHLNIGQQAFII